MTFEPAARAVAGAREALEAVQAGPVVLPAVDDAWIDVACDHGDVRVRLIRPAGATDELPVVLYVHGGGWVVGGAATHDRLVRELAVGARTAVAFVDYDRSPESQYPVAIEQTYAAARWITRHGVEHGLDADRLAIAGDCAGGAVAAAVTILAGRRGDVAFVHQSLYYPVTDAGQDTVSYREFTDGPHLTAAAMAWFWDCYLPEVAMRADATASPLRATADDLARVPPALIIVAEHDVLRDEGEAYARALVDAGVPTTVVRVADAIHDVMMLNPVRGTVAAGTAIDLAITTMKEVLT
ncbi:alpha/beta hydrolase [Mycolicibacterium sediminis]|uniref:Esterase n=1 Tax=Mycolicibacterium sediminis TaxID=1286180 RepID=A0A7I7QS56_9MYCO|nr:alpha/beta hydrolase [Mycolicibacterium sediminis]BBY29181.1 esterase [Mycolicibacterium sediminis]